MDNGLASLAIASYTSEAEPTHAAIGQLLLLAALITPNQVARIAHTTVQTFACATSGLAAIDVAKAVASGDQRRGGIGASHLEANQRKTAVWQAYRSRRQFIASYRVDRKMHQLSCKINVQSCDVCASSGCLLRRPDKPPTLRCGH